jgi:hypothetical protein
MEGVAAFSLACNVLQIAELSRKLVATAREIQSSRNGTTSEHEDLQAAASSLRRDVGSLQQKDKDDVTRQLASRCQAAVDEHVALLQSFRLKGSTSMLQASIVAAKVRWKQRQLDESQARVDRLSKELTTHVIMTYIPNIDSSIGALGEDVAAHSKKIDQEVDVMKRQLARVGTVVGQSLRTADATQKLVTELHRWILGREEVQLHKQRLHALYFPQLRSREDEVKAAHKKTFSWILDENSEVDKPAQRSKFKQWLRSDDPQKNVFWISGKPGAGKSTLMKFIAHHPALRTGCSGILEDGDEMRWDGSHLP